MNYFRRFFLLIFLLCISVLYFPLNQFLTHGHNLKTPLDIYIPLVPIFAVPYLLFVPYWIGAFLFFAWKMHDRVFRALMIGSIGAVDTTIIALFGITWRPKLKFVFYGSVLLVILGTLLTGQHHLVDPIGGFALGLLAHRFGIWMEYGTDGIRRTLVINA